MLSFSFKATKFWSALQSHFQKKSILSYIYSNTDGSLDAKKKKKKALYDLLLLILA